MKIRLKYFVYPQFQLSLLLVNTITNLFLFTFLSAKLQMYFSNMIENGKKAGLASDNIYFQFLINQKNDLFFEFNIALVVSLILTSVLILWISHRLAGPIIRLRNHLKSTAEGETYRKIKFRQNDYFQDIPEYLDKAFEKIIKNESK